MINLANRMTTREFINTYGIDKADIYVCDGFNGVKQEKYEFEMEKAKREKNWAFANNKIVYADIGEIPIKIVVYGEVE